MLQMGLGGSVFSGGYTSQAATGTAANPTPQGPRNIGQQAFGVVAGDSGGPATAGYAIIGGGGLALAALIFIWWSLPR